MKIETKKVYVAADGTAFESEADCLVYERTVGEGIVLMDADGTVVNDCPIMAYLRDDAAVALFMEQYSSSLNSYALPRKPGLVMLTADGWCPVEAIMANVSEATGVTFAVTSDVAANTVGEVVGEAAINVENDVDQDSSSVGDDAATSATTPITIDGFDAILAEIAELFQIDDDNGEDDDDAHSISDELAAQFSPDKLHPLYQLGATYADLWEAATTAYFKDPFSDYYRGKIDALAALDEPLYYLLTHMEVNE